MMAVNTRTNLIVLDHFEGAAALAVYDAATPSRRRALAAYPGGAAFAAEMRGAIRLLPLRVALPFLGAMIVPGRAGRSGPHKQPA